MPFLPQANETNMTIDPASGFDKKLSQLNSKLSPILPLHFDKTYLPKDLCQIQYLKLAQCRIFTKLQHSNICSFQVTKFERCRKNRDIRILDGIKRWQHQHINSLQRSNKKMYLQGLTFKLDRLKQDFEKIPSTASKQIKLTEIQNQIETIKWRINYIKKIV